MERATRMFAHGSSQQQLRTSAELERHPAHFWHISHAVGLVLHLHTNSRARDAVLRAADRWAHTCSDTTVLGCAMAPARSDAATIPTRQSIDTNLGSDTRWSAHTSRHAGKRTPMICARAQPLYGRAGAWAHANLAQQLDQARICSVGHSCSDRTHSIRVVGDVQ